MEVLNQLLLTKSDDELILALRSISNHGAESDKHSDENCYKEEVTQEEK